MLLLLSVVCWFGVAVVASGYLLLPLRCLRVVCRFHNLQVMRKDRVLARDHREYIKAERDVLTAVVHPYIVTLRYSFQVSCGWCEREGGLC